MTLLSTKDLSPKDRMTYRRWVGGLFASYAAILMIVGSIIAYQVMIAPTQTQALGEPADARSIDTIGSSPVRQAVKYD